MEPSSCLVWVFASILWYNVSNKPIIIKSNKLLPIHIRESLSSYIYIHSYKKKNIKCSKNLFSLLNVKQRYCIINMLTKRKPFGFFHWLLLLLRNILINPNKKKNVNDLLKCFWRQITIFSESLHPNLRS